MMFIQIKNILIIIVPSITSEYNPNKLSTGKYNFNKF